jgi:integrase
MAGVTGSLNAARLYFPELENYRAPSLPGLVVESRSTLVPRAELRRLVTTLRKANKYANTRSGVADLLELLQLTGARVSELTTLEPAQIDFDRHLLTLSGSKTHTKRTIPMSDRVESILRNASLPSYCAAHQTLKVICEQEGIRFGRSGWVIHDIRHTAASILAEAGISHSIIAALLGHRLGGMTAIYTHATLPALKQAVSVLETYWLGEQKPLRIVSTF